MPTFCQATLCNTHRRGILRFAVVACAAVACAAVFFSGLPSACLWAQTLARPGWAGSGLTPEAWYQHAVFYRIENPSEIPTEVELPSLQAFGIDAVLLTTADLRAPVRAAVAPAPTGAATAPSSANPAVPGGEKTDLSPGAAPNALVGGTPLGNAPLGSTSLGNAPLGIDDLLFECSRLHMRVFVPLDLTRLSSDVLAEAKSWLYRGAAGFILRNLPQAAQVDAREPSAREPSAHEPKTAHSDAANVAAARSLHLSKTGADAPIVAALHTLLLSFPGNHLLLAEGIPSTASIQLQIVALASATSPPAAEPPAAHPLLTLGGGSLSLVAATRLLATPYPAMISSSALTPAQLHHVFSTALVSVEPEPVVPPAPPPPPANVYGAYRPYIPRDTVAERRKEAEAKAAREQAEQLAADTFPVQPMYESIGATPEAQIAFYHRLIQLHRAKTTNAGSALLPLESSTPAIAWAVHRAGTPDIVVVCNPSDLPQRVVLRTRQTLETLRTLLHTAAASGVETTDAIPVGPHGVYVGQVLGR